MLGTSVAGRLGGNNQTPPLAPAFGRVNSGEARG